MRRIDASSTLILLGTFVAVWLLWDTPLVYPVKIFVVCLHELGHAVAALLTGGQVVGIQVFSNQGGLAITRGGWRLAVLSAGYLGSVLAGGLLLYVSSYRRWGCELMVGLAVLMAASTLLFFRNAFAIVYGVLAAGAMLFSAFRLPDEANYYILRFVAMASCLYALLDIRSDLFAARPAELAGLGVVNDATALAQLTGLPALAWAVGWMALSVCMLFVFLYLSAQVPDAHDEVGLP